MMADERLSDEEARRLRAETKRLLLLYPDIRILDIMAELDVSDVRAVSLVVLASIDIANDERRREGERA